MPTGVYVRTEETRARISAASKGRPSPNKGKHMTEEQKNKLRAANIGKHHTEETKAKIRAGNKGKRLSDKTKAKIRASDKKTWQSPELRAHNSAITKARWQDPEYIKKVFAKCQPNKAELKLQEILNRHFPGMWKYVGNGQVNLGGRFPDFINVNGKKEIIELFGERWHPIFHIAQKKEHYKQYGFRVAIIWEDELEDEERLVKGFRKKFMQ